MLRRLSEHEEGTAQIGGNHLVKHFHVAISDSSKRHDARAVYHYINPVERIQRLFEETLPVGGIRHIGLHGDRQHIDIAVAAIPFRRLSGQIDGVAELPTEALGPRRTLEPFVRRM